jgi:hypothetical protein
VRAWNMHVFIELFAVTLFFTETTNQERLCNVNDGAGCVLEKVRGTRAKHEFLINCGDKNYTCEILKSKRVVLTLLPGSRGEGELPRHQPLYGYSDAC